MDVRHSAHILKYRRADRRLSTGDLSPHAYNMIDVVDGVRHD
jgi:hypothetical protein